MTRFSVTLGFVFVIRPSTLPLVLTILLVAVCSIANAFSYPDSATSSAILKNIYADNYQDAIEELTAIQQYFETTKPTREYIKLLIDVGAAFNEKGDYGSTQQYSFMALGLASQEVYEDLQAEVLIDIGYTYYFLEQLEKGIEYGERALVVTKKLKLDALRATAHNLLGILHAKSKHDSDIIMDHYMQALQLRKSKNNARGVASTVSNIALQLESDGRFNEALDYQLQSLRIDDSIGNEYGLAWSHQMIGALLIKMNRLEEANHHLTMAEKLSQKLKAREILLQTYKNRSAYLSGQRKFEEALHYSNLYNSLRDSIYNAGLTSKVTLLQQTFETRERDRQIMKQQAALESQRMVVIVVAVAGVLVSVLLFFYYRSYRRTLQLNREIIERTEEVETQAEELVTANRALQTLNRQIAEQKEELQAQAEELTESNQTIHSLNEKLHSDIALKTEELIKTNEELVRHNNELLQFSFTLSHNLRGPVARMLGLMNIIAMTTEPEQKESYTALLQKATEELDVILKDLNLIIDSRNNLFKVREKIAFEEEWKKSMSLLADYILPDFTIQTDFSELPYVFSVRGILQNVIYNLFSNAIRYRSPERPLQIEVKTFSRNHLNYFTIRDNGLGIDLTQHSDKIFKLYKRFHTHITGKGLGLYLVKTQVESLGGSIQVESELNRGTLFIISFPEIPNIDEQVILENESARLVYDANINNTIIVWKRNISSAEYHEVFENVMQTLRMYSTPAWIADLRNQGVVSEKDQQWFMKTVLPQAVECGLKRVGTVGFTDPVRKIYYDNMRIKSKELGIDLRVFDSLEEAKQWMSSFLNVSGQHTSDSGN